MEKEKHYIVSSDVALMGHLRDADIHMTLTEDEYNEFKAMSKEEQEDWLRSEGTLSGVRYVVDSREYLTRKIKVEEVMV